MRLLTHNFLQSNVKGTEKGYPLIIEPATVIIEESPVDRTLVTSLLPKLEYSALLQALKQLAPHVEGDLPELPDLAPSGEVEDALVADLHKVLFDVHVTEGFLVCPDTGRKFPIKDGIPNMILHEDEI